MISLTKEGLTPQVNGANFRPSHEFPNVPFGTALSALGQF